MHQVRDILKRSIHIKSRKQLGLAIIKRSDDARFRNLLNKSEPKLNRSSRSWRWVMITLSSYVARESLIFENDISFNSRLIATQTLYSNTDQNNVIRIKNSCNVTATWAIFGGKRSRKNGAGKNVHRSIRKLMSGNELTMSRGCVNAGIIKTRLRCNSYNRDF